MRVLGPNSGPCACVVNTLLSKQFPVSLALLFLERSHYVAQAALQHVEHGCLHQLPVLGLQLYAMRPSFWKILHLSMKNKTKQPLSVLTKRQEISLCTTALIYVPVILYPDTR